MNQQPSHERWIARGVSWLSLMKLSSFWKMSFIVGSQYACFSAINIVAPLTGIYNSLLFSLIALMTGGIGRNSLFIASLYHIPLIFASAYWAIESRTFKIVLPGLCILLFIMHPVGNQAWFYSLYWLIPIVLASRQTIAAKAFGSTFTAHAVGSVVWLYQAPLEPSTYYALMPIVVLERLAFATGMILLYYAITYGCSRIPHYFTSLIKASPLIARK